MDVEIGREELEKVLDEWESVSWREVWVLERGSEFSSYGDDDESHIEICAALSLQ